MQAIVHELLHAGFRKHVRAIDELDLRWPFVHEGPEAPVHLLVVLVMPLTVRAGQQGMQQHGGRRVCLVKPPDDSLDACYCTLDSATVSNVIRANEEGIKLGSLWCPLQHWQRRFQQVQCVIGLVAPACQDQRAPMPSKSRTKDLIVFDTAFKVKRTAHVFAVHPLHDRVPDKDDIAPLLAGPQGVPPPVQRALAVELEHCPLAPRQGRLRSQHGAQQNVCTRSQILA
mmetsp:Transcript_69127/g.191306  ORF Transcript_69127/g.191306 Transcript_69127/m.191306 type:complete len:228 (-) Transcript_69127:88-771(-)